MLQNYKILKINQNQYLNMVNLRIIAQKWLIPPSLYKWTNHYFYQFKAFFKKDFQKVIKQNIYLEKEAQKNDRCFIIGSGPSLKKTNIKILENEACFFLNHTYLHEDFKLIKNKFCVLSGFACHTHLSQEQIHNVLFQLETLAVDAKLILNIEDREIFESSNFDLPKSRYYFDWNLNWSCLNRAKLAYDRPICPPQNSVIFAIQVALCMKFKNIYLVGIDHDFIISALTNAPEHHFYNQEESKLGNVSVKVSNIANSLAAHSLIWNQHIQLNQYAQKLGISIFNATQGGILDVYPRVSLEDLIE
ncbi:hypothetical protein NSP_23280 [Nodularia spumigena CCY9414]|nr:hypothetical protein NSP_23280 [Nodularia spumigena CCY9414]EAW43116.1 hypothetical protein N9414_07953 [Nodularia spumigena CCY9414]